VDERGTLIPALIPEGTPARHRAVRRAGRFIFGNEACAALLRTVLASMLLLTPPGSAAEPFSRGVLWRLDRPGVATSWVFGTLHSNDPRVTALPAPVAEAFSRARTFAMESFWSETGDAQFYEAMQFDDGRLPLRCSATMRTRNSRKSSTAWRRPRRHWPVPSPGPPCSASPPRAAPARDPRSIADCGSQLASGA